MAKRIDERVSLLEDHIVTLNKETGEIKNILSNPNDGLILKVDRIYNNLKWIKWLLVVFIIPIIILIIDMLVRSQI